MDVIGYDYQGDKQEHGKGCYEMKLRENLCEPESARHRKIICQEEVLEFCVSAERNCQKRYLIVIGQKKVELSDNVSELVGIIFGDGNIWTNNRKYEVTITAGVNDRDYFDKICQKLKSANLNTYERKRGRGLRVTVYSKALFTFLVHDLGVGWGRDKSRSPIPKAIIEKKQCLSFVRGVFDTDGSVFTSKKRGICEYPSIEITNKNTLMLSNIEGILRSYGFRSTLRSCKDGTNKLSLYGRENVKRWNLLIGSSHPRKKSKMEAIIKTYS